MRTTFGPDDEDAFEQARTQLMAAYAADPAGPTGGDTFVADMMVTYKWGYADGRITHWRGADLEGLLLDFFPRKVTLDEGEEAHVPSQAAAFLAFLDRQGMLTGDPLPRLRDALERLTPGFLAALADTDRQGFATRLVRQMRSEGFDPTDKAQVDAWMVGFSSRSRAERDAILGPQPPFVGPGDVPDGDEDDVGGPDYDLDGPLPPVELAPVEELEAAARASALLGRLTAFTRHFERPRKLTAKGNLTLADGRALLRLLGIGVEDDAIVRAIEERMRSTAQLRDLALMLRWAKAAGFVKVRHGSLSATRRGQELGKHVLRDWRTTFEAFALRGVLDPGRESPFHAWWTESVSEFVATLPVRLYATAGRPIDDLRDELTERLEEEFDIPDRIAELVDPRRWAGDDLVRRGIEPLTALGAFSVTDDRVSLTPLGTWAMNQWFGEHGFDAPVRGDLSEASALDLLLETALWPLDDATDEARRWIAARPVTAASELTQAIRRLATEGLPDDLAEGDGMTPMDVANVGFHILDEAGPTAEAEVRTLLEVEPLHARALLWLVANGHEDQSSLPPDELQGLLVETLATLLDGEGPAEMAAHVAGLGPDTEQIGTIEAMLRARHPRTDDILRALGQHHPSKAVSKAARKTAFKRSGYH